MGEILHSVKLDIDKCIGCTDCIKRCPTEAIRVRNGKAHIMDERCIDCGMCIRVCRNHAKKAVTEPLDKINDYAYKVAIPAPTLYTQFRNIVNPNIVLTALKKLGFDEVFEVAKAAEIITAESKRLLDDKNMPKPVISSACPAIVRLIQIRFPSLIPNILPIISPKEAMARYAKEYLMGIGIKKEDIGVFFISPCAAKVTNSKQPQVIEESYVDGVISLKEIYLKLVPVIKTIDQPERLQMSNSEGIGWAHTGGEGNASGIENHIAVDGIENVIKILEKVENGKLDDVDFIECLACVGGCLGGPLAVENAFVSSNRMDKIKKFNKNNLYKRDIPLFDHPIDMYWTKPLKTKQVLKLDDDMEKAIEKLEHLEEIYNQLPKIDCGSCGAPTCRALAEDIVCENAHIEDCVFMLREKVRDMAEQMVTLSQKMPPSISKDS
ncbi:4Fe-4S dicluster domain-containing protein [Vallitalea pronyensis]|uniref:4Fe-4S dicluster domain-containing protein n=1 Tax=Vallitalea pronyensis TaxID=1348613 RepID=A0A8J8SH00_9FIRM|nr:[Fe-Fe] hydrogenase large subunit C-terminal domain-containing protein [Vallitalea pronyensis]QUI23320.1 4Fe-4S dicluster domain-containing protein [Vallitalea pronyensis]